MRSTTRHYATPVSWQPRKLPNTMKSRVTERSLRAWAKLLGQEEAVELLSETLAEEKHADELLTSIADGGTNESATERPLAAE